MTPEQALKILDQATSQSLLSRQDHNQVLQALMILKQIVEERKSNQTNG